MGSKKLRDFPLLSFPFLIIKHNNKYSTMKSFFSSNSSFLLLLLPFYLYFSSSSQSLTLLFLSFFRFTSSFCAAEEMGIKTSLKMAEKIFCFPGKPNQQPTNIDHVERHYYSSGKLMKKRNWMFFFTKADLSRAERFITMTPVERWPHFAYK